PTDCPAGGAGTEGIPGLDRCNSGNDTTSPVVAVDDVALAGGQDLVLVSYAAPNGASENVLLSSSVNSGATCSAPTVVNGSNAGRRFMPWVCATGGSAYLTWYDSRNRAAADLSLTDYYGRGASINGMTGAIALGNELRISNASDSMCAG